MQSGYPVASVSTLSRLPIPFHIAVAVAVAWRLVPWPIVSMVISSVWRLPPNVVVVVMIASAVHQ